MGIEILRPATVVESLMMGGGATTGTGTEMDVAIVGFGAPVVIGVAVDLKGVI
jgi:hypothetical protein